MRRFASILVLLCWLASGVWAQQYGFHAFRQAEGLGNLAVTSLTRDTSGFLWVGSENGVYRFVGSGFQRFGADEGIADVDIRDVLADPSGTVWAGTESDLYRWDGIRFLPVAERPISVPGRNHMAIEDDRHLLVIDNGRLYRLEHNADGKTTSFLPVMAESVIAANPELWSIQSVSVVRRPTGVIQIWMCAGKKLYSFTEGSGTNLTVDALRSLQVWGASAGVPEDDWFDVILDRKGNIWAAGVKNIVTLAPGSGRFIDRDIPGANHDNIFGHSPLLEDLQGRMLAPTGKGLGIWNGSSWRIVGRANGLKRVTGIDGMAFDASGNLFLASRGNGLTEWPAYGDWEGWDDETGLPSPSAWNVVFGRDNRVFLGTDQGPAVINPADGDSAPVLTHQAWNYRRASAMGFRSDGALWVAAYSGEILLIDPKRGTAERKAALQGPILWGFQTSSGQAFLFGRQMNYTFDGENLTYRPLPENIPGLDHSSIQTVQSVCEAPDRALWFAGGTHLARFKDGAWSVPQIDGLPRLGGNILGLACDRDGSLWFTGDLTGTWHLQPREGRFEASRLRLPDNLKSLSCLALLKDRRGWLWIGTEQGVLVWNGSSWRHLTEESGLIWNDSNQGVLKEGPDGSIWIGTNGGISHLIHPEHVFGSIPLGVSLIEKKVGVLDFMGSRKIVMAEGGPRLRFQLASSTLRNRGELHFKIRMTGYINDWVETEDGIANFSRLRAGNYVFSGTVCDPIQGTCAAPVSVAVTVLPAWWNSTLFRIAIGVVVLLLVLAGVHLYSQHLRRRSKELERLVAKRTEELEASRELLRVQATYDGLTGMLNRTSILNALSDELERARRERRTLVVALADLDHFKRINDEFGHLAGDEALRQFSQAVRSTVRPYDHSGRYGGEEFLLVLTNIPVDAAEQRLRAIHAAMTNLSVKEGTAEFRLNCSVGAVICSPVDKTQPESLLAIADMALYDAKASGRNRLILRNAELSLIGCE